MSDKTEEPTPRRLRKAQEEGDSGASAFAAQAVAFLAALAVVPAAARALAASVGDRLREVIARAAEGGASGAFDAEALATDVAKLSLPVLGAAAVTAAVAHLVQTGGVVATKKLAPKLERLDVVAGFRNLVSGTRLFAVARALVGAAVVAWLARRALTAHAVDLARLSGRLAHVGRVIATVAWGLARDAALIGLAMAALDVIVVRRAWRRRLFMTKDEVKREHKESEGDPQLKAARERAHREVIAQATLASVKNATVVVVNPTHVACALRYDEEGGDAAPVVVASGEGELAERIVRAAHDYGVPVVRDVPLARALLELEVGVSIPEELYEAVAEVLKEAWGSEGA